MESNKSIRVLHIVTSIDIGGVGTFLLSYYKKMNRAKVQFDIVTIDIGKEQLYEASFKSLGAKIYYMPKNYWKRLIFLFQLIRQGNYNIVHSHIELASAIYLLIAKSLGIKHRIAHAHMAFCKYESFSQKFLRFLLLHVATIKMGCSADALITLFGPSVHDGIILHNAIDINKFSFNPAVRNEYRKNFNIDDKYVIGFVGRLTDQKNVFFLLDIFQAFSVRHPSAILMVVGDGELHNSFFDYAEKKELTKKILHLEARQDVCELMKAMDVLLLPSKWEGLGIVLIEAQASSLKCIAAKETIPYKDTNISEYINYCSINAPAEVWANIIEQNCIDYERVNVDEKIRNHHYDINLEANKLTEFYCKIVI